MQGDVLSPLVSSNMVDQHKKALETGNMCLYKNKVIIPFLGMVDNTIRISKCGVKTVSMNAFFNNRTNLMNLQFGSEKCVRMHIGKIHESSIFVILHLMHRGKRSLKIKIGQIHWKRGDAECVRRNISRGCGVKRWKEHQKH